MEVEYDFLDVSGTARLAGTLEVDLIDLGMGRFTPSMGDTFDVLGAASIHLEGLLLDGDSNFTAQVISDGPRETLRLTAVPEPSVFVLLAVGGVLLAGYGLRRFGHVAA